MHKDRSSVLSTCFPYLKNYKLPLASNIYENRKMENVNVVYMHGDV